MSGTYFANPSKLVHSPEPARSQPVCNLGCKWYTANRKISNPEKHFQRKQPAVPAPCLGEAKSWVPIHLCTTSLAKTHRWAGLILQRGSHLQRGHHKRPYRPRHPPSWWVEESFLRNSWSAANEPRDLTSARKFITTQGHPSHFPRAPEKVPPYMKPRVASSCCYSLVLVFPQKLIKCAPLALLPLRVKGG